MEPFGYKRERVENKRLLFTFTATGNGRCFTTENEEKSKVEAR